MSLERAPLRPPADAASPLGVAGAPVSPPPLRGLPDLIGNTPLLPIRRPHPSPSRSRARVFAKAEWFNPGGSVKDRAALAMIQEALAAGALREGQIILEATSGNTGIALAMLGAHFGYPVKLCLPETATEERKRMLRIYGAEVVETSALEGTDGAIEEARRIAASDPDKYFYPDQYNNPANWRAHYRTTANEIWEQSGGELTHFVCGLGTSGTFVGTTRRLKELSPRIRCISVEPSEPLHGIEGWKHMASSLVPGIYDPTLADESLTVATEDAYETALRLAREEGLFASVSSAAAATAALGVAERADANDEEAFVVTVLPDSGARSLSERPFRDDSPS